MDLRISESRALRTVGSLRLSIWLLMAQCCLFVAGAVNMPRMKAYGSMNSMPLFTWMQKAPPAAAWWLWASVAVIALLTLNTLACATLSLTNRPASRPWLSVLAPQVIHLGFLFMMAGHMVSSIGAVHTSYSMPEGAIVTLPGGTGHLRLAGVELDMSPRGYPLDWSAEVEYYAPSGALIKRDVTAPNRPSFMDGLGVYIKQAAYGGALIEIHREPGTPWALGGGALFTLGTLALVGLKAGRER